MCEGHCCKIYARWPLPKMHNGPRLHSQGNIPKHTNIQHTTKQCCWLAGSAVLPWLHRPNSHGILHVLQSNITEPLLALQTAPEFGGIGLADRFAGWCAIVLGPPFGCAGFGMGYVHDQNPNMVLRLWVCVLVGVHLCYYCQWNSIEF